MPELNCESAADVQGIVDRLRVLWEKMLRCESGSGADCQVPEVLTWDYASRLGQRRDVATLSGIHQALVDFMDSAELRDRLGPAFGTCCDPDRDYDEWCEWLAQAGMDMLGQPQPQARTNTPWLSGVAEMLDILDGYFGSGDCPEVDCPICTRSLAAEQAATPWSDRYTAPDWFLLLSGAASMSVSGLAGEWNAIPLDPPDSLLATALEWRGQLRRTGNCAWSSSTDMGTCVDGDWYWTQNGAAAAPYWGGAFVPLDTATVKAELSKYSGVVTIPYPKAIDAWLLTLYAGSFGLFGNLNTGQVLWQGCFDGSGGPVGRYTRAGGALSGSGYEYIDVGELPDFTPYPDYVSVSGEFDVYNLEESWLDPSWVEESRSWGMYAGDCEFLGTGGFGYLSSPYIWTVYGLGFSGAQQLDYWKSGWRSGVDISGYDEDPWFSGFPVYVETSSSGKASFSTLARGFYKPTTSNRWLFGTLSDVTLPSMETPFLEGAGLGSGYDDYGGGYYSQWHKSGAAECSGGYVENQSYSIYPGMAGTDPTSSSFTRIEWNLHVPDEEEAP
jgi:hypothetical protein